MLPLNNERTFENSKVTSRKPGEFCSKCGVRQPNHTPEFCPEAKCFHCSKKGHMRTKCPEFKCFNCQKLGHYARNCTEPPRPRKSENFAPANLRRAPFANAASYANVASRPQDRPSRNSSYIPSIMDMAVQSPNPTNQAVKRPFSVETEALSIFNAVKKFRMDVDSENLQSELVRVQNERKGIIQDRELDLANLYKEYLRRKDVIESGYHATEVKLVEKEQRLSREIEKAEKVHSVMKGLQQNLTDMKTALGIDSPKKQCIPNPNIQIDSPENQSISNPNFQIDSPEKRPIPNPDIQKEEKLSIPYDPHTLVSLVLLENLVPTNNENLVPTTNENLVPTTNEKRSPEHEESALLSKLDPDTLLEMEPGESLSALFTPQEEDLLLADDQ